MRRPTRLWDDYPTEAHEALSRALVQIYERHLAADAAWYQRAIFDLETHTGPLPTQTIDLPPALRNIGKNVPRGGGNPFVALLIAAYDPRTKKGGNLSAEQQGVAQALAAWTISSALLRLEQETPKDGRLEPVIKTGLEMARRTIQKNASFLRASRKLGPNFEATRTVLQAFLSREDTNTTDQDRIRSVAALLKAVASERPQITRSTRLGEPDSDENARHSKVTTLDIGRTDAALLIGPEGSCPA